VAQHVCRGPKENIDILAPFVDTTWHFDSSNTLRLWRSMSAGDQKLYDFDLGSIDWDDYFLQALSGIRIYLAKEEPGQETLDRAKKILRRWAWGSNNMESVTSLPTRRYR